jgi:hypothetical protein
MDKSAYVDMLASARRHALHRRPRPSRKFGLIHQANPRWRDLFEEIAV